MQSSGFMVRGLRSRVYGLGSSVKGLGVTVFVGPRV